MFYPAKYQMKIKYLMSFIGLMTIISMLIAPTLKVQALSDDENSGVITPVSSEVVMNETDLPETTPETNEVKSTPTEEYLVESGEEISPTDEENGENSEQNSATETPENSSDEEDLLKSGEEITPTEEESDENSEQNSVTETPEEPSDEEDLLKSGEEITPTEEESDENSEQDPATETPDEPSETPSPDVNETIREEIEATVTPTQTETVSINTSSSEETDRKGSGAVCDQDPNCNKIDPGSNSGSYTAPGPITSFSVKAGSNLITYLPPGYSLSSLGFCWNVSINGASVTWSRTNFNHTCQNPSHFEIYWENQPEPDPLSVSYVCLQNGNHQITVSSTVDQAISFSWYSTTGEWGWGSVSKSNPYTFTTNSTGQTISINYHYNFKSINASLYAEACSTATDLSLTYQCQDDTQHLWTVSNGNDFEIPYTWYSTSGESGSGTVPANGTDSFLSNNKAQTVTIKYSFPDKARCGNAKCGPSEEKKLSVRAEKCEIPVFDLGLSYECLDDADHKWTVTNNNAFDISYTWSSTTGEYGWGTVSANGTDTFLTNNTSQTVTIKYSFPDNDRCGGGCGPSNEESVSVTAEECEFKLNDLGLSYECLDDADHKWTVTNNNAFDISYTWSSTTGEYGWGTVSANGTDTFLTNNTSQTVTIKYSFPDNGRCGGGCGPSNEESVSVTAEECEFKLNDLGLSYECLDDGRHKWTVTNNNDLDFSYNWYSDVDWQYGNRSVQANSTDVFYTNNKSQTVSIYYDFPSADRMYRPERYLSVSAEVCSLPQKLDLSVECLPGGDHQWTVTNLNSTAITFDWASDNGINSGSGISVGGNGGTQTFTSNFEAQEVTLTYDYAGQSGITVSKATEEVCFIPQDLVITVDCLTNGDHQWTITNNNPDPITFDWESDNGIDFGSGLVVSGNGGTETFTSNTSAQSITLTYDYAGQTGIKVHSDEAQVCGQPSDLILHYECLDNGQHKWTVTNSNDFSIGYNWSSDVDSQFGNGTVEANSSDVFYTNNKDQTVTINYDFPAIVRTVVPYDRSVSVHAEVCALPQKLQVSVECLINGDHKWTVTNNNAKSITFDWASDNGIDSGSGLSVGGNGGTQSFTSDYQAQQVTLTYNYAGETNIKVNKTTEEVCFVPVLLDLSVDCLPNGDHQWTVTNNNPNPITFNWVSDNGIDSGSGLVVNGNSGTKTFTSNYQAQEVTLTYNYAGETGITVFKASEEICDVPDLTLTYICGYPSDTQLLWRIRNTNDVEVPFTWDVYGSSEGGNGTIPANSDVYFNTTLGDKTVRIFVYGQLVNTKAGGSVCKVDLELDYECLITGIHDWTVTNDNDFDQTFNWSSTSGESGSAIAPAGGSITFSTGLESETITVDYQNAPHEAKQIIVESEACKSPQLDLFYLCGYPTDTYLHWYVSNPNDVEINFEWEVIGEAESGTGTAKPNQETFFTTSKGEKSVRILVEGHQIDLEQGGETCMVTLDLSYECQDNNTQVWTVTNDNKMSQSFTWSSTNGESGSGVVAAGGEFTFTTANTDHKVTLEYNNDPFPAQETTVIAETCKIAITTPTPSVSVTVPENTPCIDWIVFHTYRDGNLEIYRLDGIEGIGNYRLINLSKDDGSDSSPSRSFNNAWVAFQSNRDGNEEIYITDSAGIQQTRLTESEASDINPMFSPNNRDIVFQSDRNGNWDLYLIDRITGEEIQLTNDEADEINPFFSMDQNWLAFESNRNGNWDIFILNITTGEEIQVTDSAADEVSPAWSPTSQQLAYLANDNGVWNLYVIDTDGENNTQITDGDGDTSHQAWSPDGTRLAYQSDRDGNVDIYSYDLRIDEEYRVTDNNGRDIGPTWDCSGTRLAFTAEDEDTSDIFQVYWKGGTSSHITNNPAVDQWSEWSPAKETASRDE